MNFKLTSLLSGITLVAGLLSSGAAMAQGTWDFGGSSCNPGGTPASASCAVGTVNATITAWGNTGSGSNFVQGSLGEFDPSGFGAYTGTSETAYNSHHAFDNKTSGCGTSAAVVNTNCGGSVEAMLLNFGSSKVSLNQIQIGWYSGDADISVYRWDGAAAGPTMTTTAAVNGTGTLSGWTLVGSNDMDLVNPFNTGNDKYSSYFLITTYFGAGGTNLDGNNDAFKIRYVTAATCTGTLTGGTGTPGGNGSSCGPGKVSEPGSLALAGLAIMGVAAVRRRKTTVARLAA